jgi:aspartate aminotransferase-like enzyme
VSDREWILLNPGPANTSRQVREALVTPADMACVVEAFAASLAELRGAGSG